jgi:hypothetical protein
LVEVGLIFGRVRLHMHHSLISDVPQHDGAQGLHFVLNLDITARPKRARLAVVRVLLPHKTADHIYAELENTVGGADQVPSGNWIVDQVDKGVKNGECRAFAGAKIFV